MHMTKRQLSVRFTVALVAIIVLPILIIKTNVLSYVYENVPVELLSALIVYVALMWPQFNALLNVKLLQARVDDEHATVRPNYLNWIPIYNDVELARYYGSDTTFKKVVYWLLICSLTVEALCLLYLNGLNTFIPSVALSKAANYLVIYALITYVVTKSFVLGSLIHLVGGGWRVFTAIVYPVGFFFLTQSCKIYLVSLQEVNRDRSMGLEYDT